MSRQPWVGRCIGPQGQVTCRSAGLRTSSWRGLFSCRCYDRGIAESFHTCGIPAWCFPEKLSSVIQPRNGFFKHFRKLHCCDKLNILILNPYHQHYFLHSKLSINWQKFIPINVKKHINKWYIRTIALRFIMVSLD